MAAKDQTLYHVIGFAIFLVFFLVGLFLMGQWVMNRSTPDISNILEEPIQTGAVNRQDLTPSREYLP